MSVADQLGLWDETSELLALADQRWGHWAAAHPALTHCCGVGELRSWLRGADKAEADEALHALATLAAVDGGNDIAAAAALAWAMMPGACTLANRLRTLDWRIDEFVAAQLWVEVRTFPWRRLRKVAANVLMNTRTGVLRDCNAKSQLERTDPTWSKTSPVDPYGAFWGGYAAQGYSADRTIAGQVALHGRSALGRSRLGGWPPELGGLGETFFGWGSATRSR